jgi:cobalamin biosynthesis protein CobT
MGGVSDDDDDDESDDEDYDAQQDVEEGDDDSEEEGSEQQAEEDTPAPTQSSAGHQRVAELCRVYSTANDKSAHHHVMKPLILDVGVALPSESSMTEQALNVAGGKAINELSYRVQWRNYFRFNPFVLICA